MTIILSLLSIRYLSVYFFQRSLFIKNFIKMKWIVKLYTLWLVSIEKWRMKNFISCLCEALPLCNILHLINTFYFYFGETFLISPFIISGKYWLLPNNFHLALESASWWSILGLWLRLCHFYIKLTKSLMKGTKF